MQEMMKRIFRRTEPVRIITKTGEFQRNGILHRLGSDTKTFMTFEMLRCGRLEMPLYRYLGDAEELLSGDFAQIVTAEAVYTVLKAESVTGLSGRVYVEAILERRVENDG